jgi:hypothetical protein
LSVISAKNASVLVLRPRKASTICCGKGKLLYPATGRRECDLILSLGREVQPQRSTAAPESPRPSSRRSEAAGHQRFLMAGTTSSRKHHEAEIGSGTGPNDRSLGHRWRESTHCGRPPSSKGDA